MATRRRNDHVTASQCSTAAAAAAAAAVTAVSGD